MKIELVSLNSIALTVMLLLAPAFPAAAQSTSGPLPVSSQMKLEQAVRDSGAGPASARSLVHALAASVPQTRLTVPDAQMNDDVGYSVSLELLNRSTMVPVPPMFLFSTAPLGPSKRS